MKILNMEEEVLQRAGISGFGIMVEAFGCSWHMIACDCRR